MTVLADIQTDEVNPEVDVAIVLRKCKILAARLGSSTFEQWVDSELGGYPPDAPLPPYRVGPPLALKGKFMNAAWEASGISVPLTVLPDHLREDLATPMQFREGVAACSR
jgi:hypothetical protein